MARPPFTDPSVTDDMLRAFFAAAVPVADELMGPEGVLVYELGVRELGLEGLLRIENDLDLPSLSFWASEAALARYSDHAADDDGPSAQLAVWLPPAIDADLSWRREYLRLGAPPLRDGRVPLVVSAPSGVQYQPTTSSELRLATLIMRAWLAHRASARPTEALELSEDALTVRLTPTSCPFVRPNTFVYARPRQWERPWQVLAAQYQDHTMRACLDDKGVWWAGHLLASAETATWTAATVTAVLLDELTVHRVEGMFSMDIPGRVADAVRWLAATGRMDAATPEQCLQVTRAFREVLVELGGGGRV